MKSYYTQIKIEIRERHMQDIQPTNNLYTEYKKSTIK